MSCGITASDEFLDVAGESTKPLQYYCNILPITNLTVQRKFMFLGKLRFCDNVVLRTLSLLKRNAFAAVGSKYDINAYDRPTLIYQSEHME